VSLPEQLLLSDLLRRRVRCDQGIDHGVGVLAWMHPPVHRLLGWISKPSAFGDRRQAWRLDQLRGLAELEVLVKGEPAQTDCPTVDRLPTLIDAVLFDRHGEPLGSLVDAAIEQRTGRILHYLVARSDPRLPGSSRWRLTPDRIVDQQPAQVLTALSGLDDLPLARASVRQELVRRSRRWRDQMQEETTRLRDQFQQAGDRWEDRLEGWLEPEDAQGADAQSGWGRDQFPDNREPWERLDEDFEEGFDQPDTEPSSHGNASRTTTRNTSRRSNWPEDDDPWI